MGFFKFFFCLFFLLPLPIYGKNSCRASSCGKNIFPVTFPFRLEDDQQPIDCGYPGFNLSCNKQGLLTLKFPQSGEFFVRSIDYLRQEIKLYDPFGCMAKRLPKLNLSGSPFKAASYMNFSFLSCSSSSRPRFSSFAVDCLSNSTNTVLAVPTAYGVDSFDCQELYDRSIHLPESTWTYNTIFSDLPDDIPLTWDVPDCKRCESSGGTCEFGSSLRVKCLGRPATAAKGVRIFGFISLFVTFCGFAISFLICFIKLRRVRRRMNFTTTAQQPRSTVAGLDETTIQSYAIVVIGESCRLPSGTSHGTCPICLSEYTPKETVKCIPECKHCFHADCIDEWFRLTGTCPVCRIRTPTPSPTHASL